MALYGGGLLHAVIRRREIKHSEGRNEEETDNPLQVYYYNAPGRKKEQQTVRYLTENKALNNILFAIF